jgi:hypothetical protein
MTSVKFEFETDTNQHYIKKIDLSLILHIEKIDDNNASIYFTNSEYSKLNIPDEIVFYIYDNKNNKIILNKNKNTEIINIKWSNSFSIDYKDKSILNVKPQRTWNITE